MSKEEKYPQIVLETDGTYVIFIEKNVKVSFNSKEAIEDFTKNKDFTIIGKDAYLEGSKTKEELLNDLIGFYPNLNIWDKVYYYKFELISK